MRASGKRRAEISRRRTPARSAILRSTGISSMPASSRRTCGSSSFAPRLGSPPNTPSGSSVGEAGGRQPHGRCNVGIDEQLGQGVPTRRAGGPWASSPEQSRTSRRGRRLPRAGRRSPLAPTPKLVGLSPSPVREAGPLLVGQVDLYPVCHMHHGECTIDFVRRAAGSNPYRSIGSRLRNQNCAPSIGASVTSSKPRLR